MRHIPNAETLALLKYLGESIPLWQLSHHVYPPIRRPDTELPTLELATIRASLLLADTVIKELDLARSPLYADGDPARFDWLTYHKEIKVIPIYDDAIALMRTHSLIQPYEVPNLLNFISVDASNYGVDKKENHGFGYHFHFGKVQKNKLQRVNVVFTFDHTKPVPPKSHDPLFYEEHGSGQYDPINISTVGQNIRLPVYKICEAEMLRIGRDNFKEPSKKASIFY